MSRPASAPTRQSSPVQERILAHLRDRIVAGDLRPGDQLPTRAELREQFGASPVTIHRAVSRLLADGFLAAEGRRGTFVTEHPPHLARFGLVFPHHPKKSTRWPIFWDRLAQVARGVEADRPVRLPLFYDTHEHYERDLAELERLEISVQTHCVAGLFFAASPHRMLESPALRASGLPRVAVMDGPSERMPDVVAISLDYANFFDRAIEALASRGRRRAALLTSGQPVRHMGLFGRAADAHGLQRKNYWQHTIPRELGVVAATWVQLLMSNPADRPDALVVADDNIAQQAIAGLEAAGLRIGQDLDVVVHCNFPDPSPVHPDAIRLGFDVPAVLEAGLRVLEAQRRGEKVGRRVKLAPVTAEEAAAAGAVPAGMAG